MKELILKALQTKFPGVEAKILERMAEKLAKTTTNEEDVQTTVDGVTFQNVLESYGDYRATESAKTSISNYEKKYKLKDGKVIEEPADPKPGDPKPGDPKPGDNKDPKGDDMPAWAKALVASVDAVNKRFEAQDAEKAMTLRKSRLAELLKEAPESIRKMYESNFESMNFKDDAAYDAWLETTKTTVEGIVNDFKAKGAHVHPPMGGGNKPAKGEVNPILKQQVEAAKANPQPAAAGPVILGMPTAN